jgi:hypothetical protein
VTGQLDGHHAHAAAVASVVTSRARRPGARIVLAELVMTVTLRWCARRLLESY